MSIHLNLCLWRPALPVPPRPPAPRPCFFPRPCVRLPRILRVLRTTARRLLENHPLEQIVDRLPTISEVAAVVVAALDPAEALDRGVQAQHRPEALHVLERRFSLRHSLAQVPDGLELAVGLDESVVDGLVTDRAPSPQERLCKHLLVDLAPRDVVLDHREHPREGWVLRDDDAVVLAGEMQHLHRVAHRVAQVVLAPEPDDRVAHFSPSFSSSASEPSASLTSL